MLDAIAHNLNNTPSAILGFRTPLEVQENIDSIVIPKKNRVKCDPPAPEAFYNVKILKIALYY